jgi:uncharacterized protein involved in exopolysaccharide biosynthesis
MENDMDRWSLSRMLPAVWAYRKGLLLVAGAAALITLIVNLLLPPYYRTVARLLPDIERNRLPGLSQAAEVAQLVGVGGSGQDPGRLYPAILTSETILRDAALTRYRTPMHPDSADLISIFELDADLPARNLEDAAARVREAMTVQFDNRTGVVTATLELPDPQLAADVLNTIVASLDLFMRQKRSTNATEQRRWVETRLRDVRVELRTAEENLKAFREKNRRLLDSPELMLEQERYAREVEIKSTVLIELVKQLELAKIEEIRNIAIVNVLDAARPPARKAGPKRAVNTILAFLGTLLAGAFYVGVRTTYPALLPPPFAPGRRTTSAVRVE